MKKIMTLNLFILGIGLAAFFAISKASAAEPKTDGEIIGLLMASDKNEIAAIDHNYHLPIKWFSGYNDGLMNDQIAQETSRRRTFAIISHPDAGKTTLTEKLLLYGGALGLAGSVTANKRQRDTASDWMEL